MKDRFQNCEGQKWRIHQQIRAQEPSNWIRKNQRDGRGDQRYLFVIQSQNSIWSPCAGCRERYYCCPLSTVCACCHLWLTQNAGCMNECAHVKSVQHLAFVRVSMVCGTSKFKQYLLKHLTCGNSPSFQLSLSFGFCWFIIWYTLPETNSNSPWKLMLGSDDLASFWEGPSFQVLLFMEELPINHLGCG